MIDYNELIRRFDNIPDLPVSEEILGAYIEGNLDKEEVENVESIVKSDVVVGELIEMSDDIDIDIEHYMSDPFTYEVDMIALDDYDFNIPSIKFDQRSLVLPYKESSDNQENSMSPIQEQSSYIEFATGHSDMEDNTRCILEHEQGTDTSSIDSYNENINDDIGDASFGVGEDIDIS